MIQSGNGVDWKKCGSLLNSQQFQHNNPHLVQHIEGYAHEQHVEDVRGRSEKGGDDADDQHCVAAVFFKERSGQDSYLGHEDHEDGQLEDQPEGEDKDGDKGNELADGDNGLELFRLEIQQEINAEGQGEEIAKGGPAVEQKAGEEHEPEDKGAGQGKGLGQGAPEKKAEHGHEGEDRHGQGDGDMGEKWLGHREKGEFLVEMILDVRQQVAGDAVEAKAAEDQSNSCRQDGPPQVFDDDGETLGGGVHGARAWAIGNCPDCLGGCRGFPCPDV